MDLPALRALMASTTPSRKSSFVTTVTISVDDACRWSRSFGWCGGVLFMCIPRWPYSLSISGLGISSQNRRHRASIPGKSIRSGSGSGATWSSWPFVRSWALSYRRMVPSSSVRGGSGSGVSRPNPTDTPRPMSAYRTRGRPCHLGIYSPDSARQDRRPPAAPSCIGL